MSRGRGKKGRAHQQVQIPITRQIVYSNCTVDVVKREDGGREIHFLDPGSHTLHKIPLPPETARDLGNKLFSAVPIASADAIREAA